MAKKKRKQRPSRQVPKQEVVKKPEAGIEGPFIHFFDNSPICQEQCKSCAELMVSSYLEPRVMIEYDHEETFPSNLSDEKREYLTDYYKKMIIANVKRIQNTIGDDVATFRINCKKWCRDIFIKSLHSLKPKEYHDRVNSDGAILHITEFCPGDGYTISYSIIVVTNYDPADDIPEFDKGLVTLILPIFIPDTQAAAITIRKKGLYDPTANYIVLGSLSDHLNEVRKNCTTDGSNITHDDFELRCINKMFKYLGKHTISEYIPVRVFYNKEMGYSLPEVNEFSVYNQEPIYVREQEIYPLLDFTQKENDYTSRYIQKKYPDGIPVNLRTYLTNPKYGNTLRMKGYQDKQGKEITEIVHCVLSPSSDEGSIFIIDQREYDRYTMVVEIHLRNVSSWTGINDVTWIQCGLLIRSIEADFHSPDEAFEKLFDTELLNGYTEQLHNMLRFIVAVYIVMHDRPKRVVMITEHVERKQRKRPTPIQDEPDFVVRRLLKPASEAQVYIDEMKGKLGIKYQYTCERWARKGHWRRLPHSDETVWIEPTICTRHLPLSDKEIHLKL